VLYLFFTYLSAPLCRTISAEKEKSNKRSVNAIKLFFIKDTSDNIAKVFVIGRPFSHRDRTTARTFCCFGLFFSSFEHAKNLLIMGPNNTKNLSLKCDFLIFNYEKYCQDLLFIVKNTKFDQKTVSLLCVKTKSGAHKHPT
jgi:hypothetical protein